MIFAQLKRDCPQLRDGGGPSQSGANAGARDGGWAARVANDPRRDDERGRDSGGGGYRRERARSGTRDRSLERDRADRDKRTRFA